MAGAPPDFDPEADPNADPGGAASWRLATADDVGALVDLIRAAYRGPASHERWTSEQHLVGGTRTDARSVRAAIEAERSEMLIVDGADGRPVGCARIADRGDGLVSFGMFAVDPGRQGGGIGRRLVRWAQDAAVDRFGGRVMELEALAQQELLRGWYERLGFAPTGETRAFPSHPEYAIPRRDDLYLIVLAKRLQAADHVSREQARALLARLHAAQNEMYAGGDSEPVRALLTETIEWHVPGDNAIAGHYRGIAQVLDYFRRRRALAGSTFRLHPGELLTGDGDRVAVLVDGTATIEGREHSWSTVGLYRIVEDRIAACWLLPLDPLAFDGIWSERR
jgi:ribosomal protein S18 acetylase RimI-like enzyme/ketosteroid isomerase-like protein